jgi:hypothetical protein
VSLHAVGVYGVRALAGLALLLPGNRGSLEAKLALLLHIAHFPMPQGPEFNRVALLCVLACVLCACDVNSKVSRAWQVRVWHVHVCNVCLHVTCSMCALAGRAQLVGKPLVALLRLSARCFCMPRTW